jgi:CRISPR-associated protein Csx16
MTDYFVTRHDGAREWAAQRGIKAKFLEHLNDPGILKPGDIVFGTLPLSLVAAAIERGARYVHLDLQLAESARGVPLSAAAMTAAGAALVEYHAYCIGPWTTSPRPEHRAKCGLWSRAVRRRAIAAFAFLLVLIVPVAANLVANALWAWVPGDTSGGAVGTATPSLPWLLGTSLGGAFVFLFGAWWLYHYRHRILSHAATLDPTPGADSRPVLITGVSNVDMPKDKFESLIEGVIGRIVKEKISAAALVRHRDILTQDGYDFAWLPWLQTLRAIWYHRDRIQRVLCITSTKSEAQFDLFVKFLRAVQAASPGLADTDIHIRRVGEPVDFEDYNGLHQRLTQALDEAAAGGFDEAQISVDATPGTKIYSITAAAITFGPPDLRFLYVNGDAAVRSYNASIRAAGGLLGE